jgi:hypothetical protein
MKVRRRLHLGYACTVCPATRIPVYDFLRRTAILLCSEFQCLTTHSVI